MAVGDTICNIGGKNVGQSFQRVTSGIVEVWMSLSSAVTAETATQITFSITGGFGYSGYGNFLPYRVGFQCFYPTGTSLYAYNYGSGTITNTASGGATNTLTKTFTINKPSTEVGICPYVQVGGFNYWGSHGTAGDDWYFGNTNGILLIYADHGSYCNTGPTWSFTSGGKTATLDTFTLSGRGGTDATLSYANCPYILPCKNPVSVYNSSGAPKTASAIYVYGSDGKPKKATSITIYNSSGNPRTCKL